MTTIRVTRRTPIPPEPLDGTASQSPAGPPEDATVRLELTDPPAPRTTLDGAWWPRTRDLSQELPGLVLVIPPDTTAATARQAFAAAGDRADQQEPTALLETLRAAGPAVARPAVAHG
jgi:hypothetical protein